MDHRSHAITRFGHPVERFADGKVQWTCPLCGAPLFSKDPYLGHVVRVDQQWLRDARTEQVQWMLAVLPLSQLPVPFGVHKITSVYCNVFAAERNAEQSGLVRIPFNEHHDRVLSYATEMIETLAKTMRGQPSIQVAAPSLVKASHVDLVSGKGVVLYTTPHGAAMLTRFGHYCKTAYAKMELAKLIAFNVTPGSDEEFLESVMVAEVEYALLGSK